MVKRFRVSTAMYALMVIAGAACSNIEQEDGTQSDRSADTGTDSSKDTNTDGSKDTNTDSSTEQPDVATRFQALACSEEGALPSGFTIGTSESYAALGWLRCLAWRLSAEGKLKVDCVNFDNECRDDWKGAVFQNGSEVTLRAYKTANENGDCDTTGCTCPNNWTFETELSSAVDDLTIVVASGDCDGSTWESARLEIAAADKGGGIACDYRYEVACGELYGRCRSDSVCGAAQTSPLCDAPLECQPATGDGTPRCLSPCTVDADCPNTDALFCDTGFCNIRTSL